MSELTIATNHQPRDVLNWGQLTSKEREEFDYLDSEDARWEACFVRYRGWVYDLSEFERGPDSLRPWDGVKGDSFFSGVLVRYADSTGESVIMGRYYS